MLDTATGLRLDVERGPDWIFVRVNPPVGSWDEVPPLAEAVWAVLEQSFTYRVVLELDQLPLLRSCLIGQLVMLAKRVHSHDGLLLSLAGFGTIWPAAVSQGWVEGVRDVSDVRLHASTQSDDRGRYHL